MRVTSTKLRSLTIAKEASATGTYRFVGSTSTMDRQGDVVVQKWHLDAYRKNPVVLFGHDLSGLPVGRAESVEVKDGRLVFDVRFVPSKLYPFAGTIEGLVKTGWLSAVSVQFRILKEGEWSAEELKSAKARGERLGVKAAESELLELSIVTVPANAEALIEGKSVVPIYAAARSPRPVMTKGLNKAAVNRWLSEVNVTKKKNSKKSASLADAIALLETDGLTTDQLKDALAMLHTLNEAKADPSEEEDEADTTEGESSDDAEGEDMPEDDDEEEKAAAPKSWNEGTAKYIEALVRKAVREELAKSGGKPKRKSAEEIAADQLAKALSDYSDDDEQDNEEEDEDAE